jgi:hypothetical protein
VKSLGVIFLIVAACGCGCGSSSNGGKHPDAAPSGDGGAHDGPLGDGTASGDGAIGPDAAAAPITMIAYPPSPIDVDIPNPERGFYDQVDLVAGGDFSFVRAEGMTLAYAPVRLDAYRAAPLPMALLDSLTAGFADARTAGIKVILRFVYNDAMGDPDAPLAQIQAHLAQLAPALAANADVIAVMQAGFIGAWGEWHDSTNGLDDPADRLAVLTAILGALPPKLSTQVRTPMFKNDAYGGPLAAANAFDGSPASRVGHHNDCFLASDDDAGTYAAPIDMWKAFVADEGRFTPVGGETCALDAPRTDCPTALAELASLHWSFLNSLWEPNVIAAWAAQGCKDQIAAELGYHIDLDSASFESSVAPGGVLHLTVQLTNVGDAAMFNARPVYVTLDNPGMGWAAPLDPIAVDPRRWEPGLPITFSAKLRVPATAALGPHRLGLWLPDSDPGLRLPTNAGFYSVRLANATWLSPFNILTSTFTVDPSAPGPVDPTATDFKVIP